MSLDTDLVAVGLFHDRANHLVICLEHGFALLPFSKSILEHLRRKHHRSSKELQAVRTYIDEIQSTLQGPATYTQPKHESIRIPRISVRSAFACNAAACSRKNGWVSVERRAVERHLSLEHGSQDRRYKQNRQSFNQLVRAVHIQSIFPHPHYHAFIVQSDGLPHAVTTSTAGSSLAARSRSTQPDVEGLSLLRSSQAGALARSYKLSSVSELAQFSKVDASVHKSQIPPWLQSTGIIKGLDGLDKAAVDKLHAMPRGDLFYAIQHAVNRLLAVASREAHTGTRSGRLSRVAARHLNSFEPKRLQAKPFRPVQESSTLKRYGGIWALLIAFLVRVQSMDDLPSVISSMQSGLQDEVTAILQYGERLGPDHTDWTVLYEGDDEYPQFLVFEASIKRLSIRLVRSLHFENPFQSPIVLYAALRTLTSEGSWVSAAVMAPLLSSLIHCMQLWLVAHCTQACPSNNGGRELEAVVEQECTRFLINTSHSPIAELSFWRLVCWKASNDTVMHPVTTIDTKLTSVSHLHVCLRFGDWRQALHAMHEQAVRVLENDLLFGLHAVPQYRSSALLDNPSNVSPGFSFLQDPRNNLESSRTWLFDQISANPMLYERCFATRETASRTASSEVDSSDGDTTSNPSVNKATFQAYLKFNHRFLRLLAVLIYMTAGLPPRREELMSLTWRNWDTARSLYISDGLVAIITGYHKSQWRIGNRPVSRFLPSTIGNTLLQYLIFVTPFLRFVRHSLQIVPAQGYLFTDGGNAPWNPDRFSDCMQRHTMQYLGYSVTTRQWRHIAIAIDRRALQSEGCSAFGIKESFGRRPLRDADQSDSDLDDDPFKNVEEDSLHADPFDHITSHLQASHSVRTGNLVYGNDASLMFGLSDSLLASFRRVSRRWHSFAGFDTMFPTFSRESDRMQSANSIKENFDLVRPHHKTIAVLDMSENLSMIRSSSSTPVQQSESPSAEVASRRYKRSHKRKATSSLTAISYAHTPHAVALKQSPVSLQPSHSPKLAVRSKLWTWPTISRALQYLYGPHASLKSDTQRDALQMVINSAPPEALVVMPTGGGKSILYILPTLLPEAQVTVVITPLVALQQDLIRRCTQASINHGVFHSRSVLLPTAAQPSLLLVDAERASSQTFQQLLADLHAAGRLDRIVLDEAHLILTASYYREQLPSLSILQRFHCPLICLTATLPPSAEREFRKMLCLTPDLETLRVSCNRPNLRYCIQSVEQSSLGLRASRDEALIDATIRLCQEKLREYCNSSSARFICYVRQKKLGSILVEELKCHYYHATLLDREAQVTAWRLGEQSPLIVATTAFGAGVDYPSVRCVIHVDAPAGLLDYAQETGRAGRDGLHADCITLLAKNWNVDWGRSYRSDFLTQDVTAMTRFLQSQSTICLRRELTRYLDGGSGTACSPDDTDEVHDRPVKSYCGNCIQQGLRTVEPSTSKNIGILASPTQSLEKKTYFSLKASRLVSKHINKTSYRRIHAEVC